VVRPGFSGSRGGGEIYRDFWKIPNRSLPIREFVAKVLEFKNLDKIAAATPSFKRADYREALVHKLKEALRTASAFLRLSCTPPTSVLWVMVSE